MSVSPPSTVNRQLERLLLVVETSQQKECDAILEAAHQEANELVKKAHSEARKRMHAAVQASRQRTETAINSARAQLATQQRQQQLQESQTLISRGQQLLVQNLTQRWHTLASRQEWLLSLIAQGLQLLPSTAWILHHPQEWDIHELDQLRPHLTGINLQTESDATIDVGAAIHGGGAILDGTLQGILANAKEIDSLILSYLRKVSL